MDIRKIIQSIKDSGLPLFYLRDPISKQPSVSLTLLMLSFHVVLFGLMNKVAGLVKGVDLDKAFELLEVTGYLYFGRTLTKIFTGNVNSKEGGQ